MTELVAHDSIQTIAAGGIAALGAKVAGDQRTSAVTARAYRHPALAPGKVVVRLEPDAIAIGTDAEMVAFGFEAPSVSKRLGQVRSRTLGFPAWALVHDPKKAKAALDVTEAMRKAKRLVASKPGHAKDAFEKIAKQLQRTAPQFLPSFWEEVGRVVADQASSAMAAQCFERARQAERAHKLKTDPEDADAAFVEFALLGALSAKTLSAYAKDLTKATGGPEAYRRFRAIIVKRALGGMPPYSGMGKDLTALAAAAKLDRDREADQLFAELVEAPGVARAPIEFWTTYREAIVRQGPQLRARLRGIWPQPRTNSSEAREEFRGTWMALLDEIGALSELPEQGLGSWMSKLVEFAGKTPLVEAVLRREAPRLIQTQQPIAVVTSWNLSLDLAELALELGIPLAEPRDDDFDSDTMTVDPVRVAAHPVYGAKLVAAVASMMGEAQHERRMYGKAGFVAARRRWIEEQIAGAETGSLPSIEEMLTTLENKTTAETFLPFPELQARLAKLDVAAAVAVHLRAGLVEEFTWPAYETALATLGTPAKVGGAFPILTAWNAGKAIAIDHTGVIAEHDLVYKPKTHEVQAVWFLDGQFYVELHDESKYETVAYWSSKPKETFECENSLVGWEELLPNQWTLPGGGVTLGKKQVRAGDTEVASETFICDGTELWRFEYGARCVPFDPISGKQGKPASPAWFAAAERTGWETTGVLFPAPAGLASSPLGLRDGMLGLRVVAKSDDWDQKFPIEYERIDGVTWTGVQRVFALASFPGDAAPRPLLVLDGKHARFLGGEGSCVMILAPDGVRTGIVNQDEWLGAGWDVIVPPGPFWDFLVPRDVDASAKLRAVTIDQARAVIAGTETIGSGAIARGVAGVVHHAIEVGKRVIEVAEARSKENADPAGQGLLGEAAQLRKLAKALAAGRATKLADFECDPREWLTLPRAGAVLAMSPVVEADARRRNREMVQALAGTILAEDLSRFRVLEIAAPDDYESPDDWDTLLIQPHEGSVFAIHPSSDWAIELSTDGAFRVPPVAGTQHLWKVVSEQRPTRGIGTQWADRYLELPDEPFAWDPQIAERLAAAADLSVPEAILLWINPKTLSDYERDFLGKKHRETFDLKTTEAIAARTTFEEVDNTKLLEVYERAAPDDPMSLRTPLAAGGYVDRLGAAWRAKFGKRTKVPQDLIAAAKKELDASFDLGKLLPAFAGGIDDCAVLKPSTRPLQQTWDGTDGFDENAASELATMIAWLFLHRPVGCAIRAGIVDVIARVRQLLANPALVIPFECMWLDDDDPKDRERGQRVLDAVGGTPITMGKDGRDECLGARDDGTLIAALYASNVYAGFRPARIDAKSRKKAEQVATLTTSPEFASQALVGLRRIELLQSDAFQLFADRVTDTPVPEDGYEANPLASAPKLVAKVAKAHDLSEPAAALYLQTLAIAEPTQQRVQLWNGWKPAQYKAASSELVKKKLVVEGKRERAGRTIFVKGAYSKGQNKDLPMEEWKQPFYTALSRQLPAEPIHLLFARAWKRVEDGDKP